MKLPLFKSVEKRLQETQTPSRRQLPLYLRKSLRETLFDGMVSFRRAVAVIGTLLVLLTAVEALNTAPDQRETMQALLLTKAQSVARKLMVGDDMGNVTKVFWEAFSVLMVKHIKHCFTFVATVPPKPTRCCDFPLFGARPGKYAFCIFDELLPASIIQNTGGFPSIPSTSVASGPELMTCRVEDSNCVNLFDVRVTIFGAEVILTSLTSPLPCKMFRSSAILLKTMVFVRNT